MNIQLTLKTVRLLPGLGLTLMMGFACGPTDTGSSTDATDASGTQTTAGSSGETNPTAGTQTAGTMGETTGTETASTEDPTSDPTTEATTSDTDSDTDATTAGQAVPCTEDPLPPEDSPCENEGEFCGPDCEDPCAFCNVMMCSGGVWQHLEVFPNECLPCEDICPFVLEPGCEGGAPDLPTCISGCEDAKSACMLEFNKMLSCAGTEPVFNCDDLTRPVIAGCESEFTELYACLP